MDPLLEDDDEADDDHWRLRIRYSIPYIDRVLRSKGLRRIVRYPYTAGDCLFDSVAYLLDEASCYSSLSLSLRRRMVSFFRRQVMAKDPKALEWKNTFLVLENLQELHPELRRIKSEGEMVGEEYLCRMMQSAANGGLWGDHFCAYWLQELLGRPIKIWMADTGKVVGEDCEVENRNRRNNDMHIVYHSRYAGHMFSHYEPAVLLESDEDEGEDEDLDEADEDDHQGMHKFRSKYLMERDHEAAFVPLLAIAAEEQKRLEPQEHKQEQEQKPEQAVEIETKIEKIEQDEQGAAESLKRFSSDSMELMQKRLKKDPFQKRIEEAIARAQARKPAAEEPRRGSQNMKVIKADSGKLTNFEVLDLLRNRAAEKGFDDSPTGITRTEVLVYGYLVQTPAVALSTECLRELKEDPLISRLRPLEVIQLANLRADEVQVHLIIENIGQRFSNEEVSAIIATIDRVLPQAPKG